MKAYITYKDSNQISEDQWESYTKVIEVNSLDTFQEVYNKYFSDCKNGANVHIQFTPTIKESHENKWFSDYFNLLLI